MRGTKKVVHITTVHHPFDTRIYHKECLSLNNAGYDVSLIAPMDEADKSKQSNIDMIPVPKRSGKLKRMLVSTWQAWRQAKSLKADLYHIHDPELLPVARLLKNAQNVVIYDVHEDYTTSITQKDYLLKPLRNLIAASYQLVERLLTKHMSFCLAEKYYQEIYPDGVCILNYPAITPVLAAHEADRRPFENKVLYTGNVSIDRGALIHAQIPVLDEQLDVHVVGKCPRDLAKTMYNITGDHSDRLNIEGIDRFIEREAIDETYVSHRWLAGLALFPPTDHYMKKELTKFFEYMAAGIPVLSSNFPVWKDFIDTHECGITVDPHKPKDIKQAVDYLRTHPEHARQMGENGKQAVMNTLNWQHEADKLIQWYDQLLGNEHRVSSASTPNI